MKPLTNVFNKIVESETIPTQWNTSEIIILHKKGDKSQLGNYRPLSLSSNLNKVFTKILKKRMGESMAYTIPKEQAGFRRGYSTIHLIHTLNQLIEKTKEYNMELHLVFVDFYKAFDSIDQNFKLETLKEQGIHAKMLKHM